jgi:sulfofructose kinase
VLCTSMAVQDFIFRVDQFPTPGTKAHARELVVTGGGNAANAAIAVARLGGGGRFCGPLGDDEMSDRIIDGLTRAGVDIAGVVRVPGATVSVSGIFVDPRGERLLTTRREQGLAAARVGDPEAVVQGVDVVLADNHFADFVLPICRAASRRGLPVVLDIDKPTRTDDPLLACASHAIFSAEALRDTTGDDGEAALRRAEASCGCFVAVTDGADGVRWLDRNGVRHQPAFAVEVVDTLAAGDVFHAAFALALAEGQDETDSLRFASAAAALKCTRFGGIIGTPSRADVQVLLRGPDG